MSETAKKQSPYRIYVVTWAILPRDHGRDVDGRELQHAPLVPGGVPARLHDGQGGDDRRQLHALKFESRALWYIVGGGLLVTSLILFTFLVPETVNVLQRSNP